MAAQAPEAPTQGAFVKTFPCAGCGAKLTFAPGTHTLKCEYCGHSNEIKESDERVEELDFETYLKALEGKQETFTEEHVRCDKCGAEQNLPSNLFASMCSFCGANIVSILVLASQTLPRELRGATTQWDLKALVPYQAEFVSGYRAEAYQVGLAEGYPLAKEQIDSKIYGLVRQDIGGDTQRVNDLSTRYSEIKFKHVLLPVWVSAYRFRNKTYRFLVNGQTGEVAGESPLSWQKVTWLVVAIIFIIILAIVLSGGHHR